MNITFSHIGNSLGTRVVGSKTRIEIEAALERNEKVVFDFSGVDVVSHSFADECFGKLLLKWDLPFLKKNTNFINANELVKKSIALTFKERLSEMIVA